MHRKITAGLALSVAVATWCTAMPAAAIDLTSPDGTWKFSLDGNVNVDYIYSNREQASSVKAIVTVGGACTDTLAQINYTTPVFGGANVNVGIFDPLNVLTEPGGTPAAKTAPGFHGKIAWSTKFSDD